MVILHIFLLSLASCGWAAGFRPETCVDSAEAAVYRRLPALSAEGGAVRTVVKFDCGEAALIRDLDHPVSTAGSGFSGIISLLEKLPIGFTRKSLDYITPYCRSDNAYYGRFCMATDIEAAKDVFSDPALLQAVPRAVRAAAKLAGQGGRIDLVRAVSSVMPGAKKYQVVKLAGFLGLDDNGVQTDRLKADLLRAGRFDDYALVFVPLSQFISGHYSDYDDGAYLARLFYATRTGAASLPVLPDGTKKTYKAFSAMYLGCKLARDGFDGGFINLQAGSLGFFYEAIKARDLADTGPLLSAGRNTARIMRTSADYGQQLCGD